MIHAKPSVLLLQHVLFFRTKFDLAPQKGQYLWRRGPLQGLLQCSKILSNLSFVAEELLLLQGWTILDGAVGLG